MTSQHFAFELRLGLFEQCHTLGRRGDPGVIQSESSGLIIVLALFEWVAPFAGTSNVDIILALLAVDNQVFEGAGMTVIYHKVCLFYCKRKLFCADWSGRRERIGRPRRGGLFFID